MYWKNANLDLPPGHKQLVLVSVDGVYYLTWYDERQKIYRQKENDSGFFSPSEQQIDWIEYDIPE
jgi:hypothetical protein